MGRLGRSQCVQASGGGTETPFRRELFLVRVSKRAGESGDVSQAVRSGRGSPSKRG